MSSGLHHGPRRLPHTPWGHLPPQLRTLFLTGPRRTGGWLAQAFAQDSASEVLLEVVEGAAAGLARLRDELFDAVLIGHDEREMNALELLDVIRAGSHDDQAIVVLGEEDEQEMAALCFEAGADAYVCVHSATTRGLIWHVARAVERHALLADNRRLTQARQQQMRREHEEADRLLRQQRAILADSPNLDDSPRHEAAGTASAELVADYRELLRTYIIMGSGCLNREMRQFTQCLAASDVTPDQVVRLHLQVVEEMVGRLGNRSARHVINRADILILEVMMHLAEGFRLRQQAPAMRQMSLPGFPTARGDSPRSADA